MNTGLQTFTFSFDFVIVYEIDLIIFFNWLTLHTCKHQTYERKLDTTLKTLNLTA